MKGSPIKPSERIIMLDVIRGFALFGILLVNMPAFHSPNFINQLYSVDVPYEGLDAVVYAFLQLFVQVKFFTIFSFLFGVGFYLFMKRAEAKGLRMKSLFFRRASILLIIGLLHLIFLWFGDILHLYAVGGFLLVAFYNRMPKTLIKWAFSLLAIYLALLSMTFFIPVDMMDELGLGNADDVLPTYIYMYESAPYLEWLSYRIKVEVIPILINIPFTLIPVFAFFLFGLYAGKKGIFEGSAYAPFIKKVQIVTGTLSIPFVICLFLLLQGLWDVGVYKSAATDLFKNLSGFSLCFFYMATLTRLLQLDAWKKRLSWLQFVGRMALTNYLAQTVICFTLFNIFNLYNHVSLSLGTAIAIVIFIAQAAWSKAWFNSFQFGPMEWLWRTFTYGHISPLRRQSKAS
ncbi:DUF418 domain-containing protein [Priestia flexa]|uniref:DUF418 domain-containing protein n=1 Tax=Priestia flexa TaxID=86664 RepID=A0A8I1MHI9_9BACI|nr:DUF418 domain-containing protein [Priestia flexa]MBN8252269.1 DUF418 domain-containing protein [Priestia flexa]UIR32116.1 DUF418 domain-containing protein [Priestia flexa]